MANIGFSPTSLIAPDLQTQLLQNQRQQALADMLKQQALQPMQSQEVSGHVVPIGVGQGLTQLARALMASRMQKGIDEQSTQLNQEYAQRMMGFMGGLNPYSGNPQSVMQLGQLGPNGENQGNVGPTVQNAATLDQNTNPDAAKLWQQGDMYTMMGNQPAATAAYAAANKIGALPPLDAQREAAALGYKPGTSEYNSFIENKFNPPIVNRGYGLGKWINGQYVPDVASTTQIGTAEAAKAAAQAPFDLVDVQLANGSTIKVPKTYLLGGQGAQQNQQMPQKPWPDMPMMPQATGFGQSTYDKARQEGAGAVAKDLVTKYGANADAAQSRKSLNNQILDIVNNSDTGPMAASQATVKNYLTKLGIPTEDFQNSPSATIALQKDLLNAATQRAKQMYGSRMTQSEVMLMLSKGAPNVDMPKAAIQFLVSSDNQTLDHQIQQSQDLSKYLNAGGDPYAFEGWYSKKFPTNITEKLSNYETEKTTNTGWRIVP